MFEGFTRFDVTRRGVRLHGQIRRHSDADAPAMVLLHGHPQTHAIWHHVAAPLTRHFHVVLMDLRGYGDSDKPPSDAQHLPYSKREMALDVLAVMLHHGFERFHVLGHDRGARVAHRLGVDHPHAVDRMMLLDIAPTLAMYEGTTDAFARAYWHWFFLIQPAPLPETLIGADPVAYLHRVMGSRHAGLEVFAPEALREYELCALQEGFVHAMCEDYRAAAGIDLEHDRADVAAGRKLTQPLRVLCGEYGVVHPNFDVLALWQQRAEQASYGTTPSGHYIPEEAPQALLDEALAFFLETSA